MFQFYVYHTSSHVSINFTRLSIYLTLNYLPVVRLVDVKAVLLAARNQVATELLELIRHVFQHDLFAEFLIHLRSVGDVLGAERVLQSG